METSVMMADDNELMSASEIIPGEIWMRNVQQLILLIADPAVGPLNSISRVCCLFCNLHHVHGLNQLIRMNAEEL